MLFFIFAICFETYITRVYVLIKMSKETNMKWAFTLSEELGEELDCISTPSDFEGYTIATFYDKETADLSIALMRKNSEDEKSTSYYRISFQNTISMFNWDQTWNENDTCILHRIMNEFRGQLISASCWCTLPDAPLKLYTNQLLAASGNDGAIQAMHKHIYQYREQLFHALPDRLN